MAARLEWKAGLLKMGPFVLAELRSVRKGRPLWRVDAPNVVLWPSDISQQRWEEEADAQQDVLTEVRRLLREAGCEVMP